MKTTRFPPTPCVECGALNDSAARLEDDCVPKPGDMTICFDCHHLMVFADDMTTRNPTDEEIVAIAGDEDVIRHMRALGRYKELERRAVAAFTRLVEEANAKTGSIQRQDSVGSSGGG